MAGPAFDPNGAVRFDLRSGSASDGRGARLLLVPAAALEALAKVDEDALIPLGSEIGRACGARVASRLGGSDRVRSSELEVVVSHLAGDLAIAGIGAVHVERWGRAMVVVVENPALANVPFLAGILGAALGAASGRDVAAGFVGREGGSMKFFIGARRTAERVASLASAGKSFAEVVATIQGGAS